jgi:hypothetical protein
MRGLTKGPPPANVSHARGNGRPRSPSGRSFTRPSVATAMTTRSSMRERGSTTCTSGICATCSSWSSATCASTASGRSMSPPGASHRSLEPPESVPSPGVRLEQPAPLVSHNRHLRRSKEGLRAEPPVASALSVRRLPRASRAADASTCATISPCHRSCAGARGCARGSAWAPHRSQHREPQPARAPRGPRRRDRGGRERDPRRFRSSGSSVSPTFYRRHATTISSVRGWLP